MGRSFTRLLHWPVRFLALAHLLFIGLFALDVFDTGLGTWQTLLSLLIHLMPSLSIALAIRCGERSLSSCFRCCS